MYGGLFMYYYPFGSVMPGRSFNANLYRYGFNGQEKDDEIKGNSNSLNFTFRMYDPRIGRFFAVDPLAPAYPELSTYQFASNTPIWAMELEGLEANYTNDGATVSDEFGVGPQRAQSGPLTDEYATSLGYAYAETGFQDPISGTPSASASVQNFIKGEEKLRLSIYYNDGGKQSLSYKVNEVDPKNPKNVTEVQKTLCCGNATIGYGHLIHKKPTVPDEAIDNLDLKALETPFKPSITKVRAEEIFNADVASIQNYLNPKIKVPISQNQYDAIISYSFNAGMGNGRKVVNKLNAGSTLRAEEHLRTKNIYAPGHTKRRKKEAARFQQGTLKTRYYFD